MTNKHFVPIIFLFALFAPNCTKQSPASASLSARQQSNASENGATQISGLGFFATENECDVSGMGATFAVKMTGDLEGCLFVFVDEFGCNQSGTYKEEGREYFVGTYMGQSGTFGPPTNLKRSMKVALNWVLRWEQKFLAAASIHWLRVAVQVCLQAQQVV